MIGGKPPTVAEPPRHKFTLFLPLREPMSVEAETISRLPPDIQAMLKRKSSRDPNSRFTSKLATLLGYVSRVPSSEEDVGVSWVDEVTFKMKKRALIGILGIKVNTLNVNLRDLKFVQQANAGKDGWTYWQKEGFTRTSAVSLADDSASPAQLLTTIKPSWPFNLGGLDADGVAQFFRTADGIWRELTGPATVQLMDANAFLQRAARYLKQEGQQEQNALDVLTAILAPKKLGFVNFEQFARFVAMFGPDRTVMLKIASLLDCSQRTGQWLSFEAEGIPLPVTGSFDPQEPNCLVIRNHGIVTKVWNAPFVEAGGKQGYVFDQAGQIYRSWTEYFEKHPLRTFGDIRSYPY
jgi:hypothetical protein